jgi:hypothetical protein
LQRIQNRPISPDVFDIDGKSPHYKFPVGAISSITNRVTGVGMSVGVPSGMSILIDLALAALNSSSFPADIGSHTAVITTKLAV